MTAARGRAVDFDELGSRLASLELVPPEEWSAGRAAVGDVLPTLLAWLGKRPARFDTLDRAAYPLLTEFQIERIAAGAEEELRLDHYQLRSRLGTGASEVFLALNKPLARMEAVKVFEAAPPGPDDAPGAADVALQRFLQEGRLLANLHHHHLTMVYHVGRSGDRVFLSMEYVQGQTLREVVREAAAANEPVPVWWAVERCVAVAEALAAAHKHGVIHRDVKPGNIMITPDQDVKLLDLGLARLTAQSGLKGRGDLTAESLALGTPEVMPPEQWADPRGVSPASDLYSLGCTLFFVLTGRMPFHGKSGHALMQAHQHEPPPSVRRWRPDVPKQLDRIVAQLLAKDPKLRPQSALQVVDALLPLAQEASPAARRPGTPVVRVAVLAAGLATLLALALVLWRIQQMLPAAGPKALDKTTLKEGER